MISLPAAPLLLICAACSPASYAVRAKSVERALAAAESAPAEEHAPYELALARLYLEKAREESGQAHYALARQLLASAEQNAVLARVLSLSRAARAEPSRLRPGHARADAVPPSGPDTAPLAGPGTVPTVLRAPGVAP